MSITTLVNLPCVLIRRSGDSDDFDDTLPDEHYVDTVCEIQQQQRSEPTDEGDLSVTQWLVIFPAGTVADSGDAVLVEDAEYQLIGAPWAVRNPRTGVEHHVEASATQTRGPGGS